MKERQIDRQIDRQTERKKEKKHTHTHTHTRMRNGIKSVFGEILKRCERDLFSSRYWILLRAPTTKKSTGGEEKRNS